MKLLKVRVKNFRCYRDEVEVDFNNLTAIIGKNDVGKSTVLEALDIFFENRNLDKNDVNIESVRQGDNVIISVVFDNFLHEINLDAGAKTNLKDEYLLNCDGLLEIQKEYTSLTKPKTYIICHHPCNDGVSNLHALKITALQKLVKELQIEGDFKASVKNEIRKALWNHFGSNLEFKTSRIEITQDGISDIWEKLKSVLPIFALFQADRKNDEKDSEIQDPLKIAAEQALKRYYPLLNKIKERVERKVTEIANSTIGKLREMNPEVAKQIQPKFGDELKWVDLFKATLTSDEIPMNKRGSGVRRLLLINFFRAEAERLSKEKNAPNVIYAIEEPETSQHPDWQIKLIEALKDIASSGTAQVIITTHSPALASLVAIKDIRFVYRTETNNVIEQGNEENFETIAKTLGLLPNLPDDVDKLKVILCLEGPTDIGFFNNISPHFGLDLKNDKRVLVLSLGGGTLGYWVTCNYLKKLNKPEIHIYDNDVAKYQRFVDMVIQRNNNSWGTLTKKREIENYVHPSILNSTFKLNREIIDTTNPKWIENWNVLNVEEELKKHNRTNVKKSIAENCSVHMTIELLKDIGAYDEMCEWFNQIKARM